MRKYHKRPSRKCPNCQRNGMGYWRDSYQGQVLTQRRTCRYCGHTQTKGGTGK